MSDNHHRDMLLAFLFAMAPIIVFAIVLLITGCSSESIRNGNAVDLAPLPRDAERESIRQRGVEFCKTYPDDVACKTKK